MTPDNQERSINTFASDIASVSLSCLLELALALQSYRQGLILVGGWAPFFLLQKNQKKDNDFHHVGSQDIDLAVNPALIDDKAYNSLEEILFQRGYQNRLDRLKRSIAFSYCKNVATSNGENQVTVDFLGPEYGGTDKSHRHQVVQDAFLLRKARGSEIAFKHNIELLLRGKLPNGAQSEAKILLADIVAILTMKGIAIGQRYKEKDAYDIVSLIENYQDGPISVAAAVQPFAGQGLVKEALENIAHKFQSRQAEGPSWVADFNTEHAPQEREQIINRSFFFVQEFFKHLGNILA